MLYTGSFVLRRKKEETENGIYKVGARLRKRRLELNMTQQQLADAIGVTKGGLSSYELDKTTPSSGKLKQLSKVLGVTEAYLCGMEDNASEGNEALSTDFAERKKGQLTDRQIGIGEHLVKLRKERGLSSEEAAKQLGISESSLEKYEKDLTSPSYELLIRIAKLLNVSTEQLLGISTGRILNIDGLSEENRRVVREIVKNMLNG